MRDARLRTALDESVRPLWLWHALEESEHKAVAFDVYRAAGGGYARRAMIILLTTWSVHSSCICACDQLEAADARKVEQPAASDGCKLQSSRRPRWSPSLRDQLFER